MTTAPVADAAHFRLRGDLRWALMFGNFMIGCGVMSAGGTPGRAPLIWFGPTWIVAAIAVSLRAGRQKVVIA